jgi:hypothetical protein
MNKSRILLITVSLVVIALLIGLGGYYFTKNYQLLLPKKIDFSSVSDSKIDNSPTANTDSTTVTKITDTGVTWLSTPQKLEDLKLINYPTEDGVQVEYYKVADLESDGVMLISAYVKFDSPSYSAYDYVARFSKDFIDYAYIKRNSDLPEADYKDVLADNVRINTTKIYNSLSAPEVLVTANNMKLSSLGSGLNIFSGLSDPKKVASSNYGDIYQVVGSGGPLLNVLDQLLYIKLADSTVWGYSYHVPFFTDDGRAQFTVKSDGTKVSNYYNQTLVATCGHYPTLSIVRGDVDKNKLTDYGVTSTGDKIYTITDPTDSLVQDIYEHYYLPGREDNHLSIFAFTNDSPFFLWQDQLNDWVIFIKKDYSVLAECGKPVVYLYPEKTTSVDVLVGAEITKSEPTYNDGWKNVLAQPTGKLTYNGKNYPYLFWEGLGNGIYPTVDSGFIVAQKDVKSTLTDHLSKLGLNQKESADFMEFWLPKMPNTPFVRLTWFTTNQMNKLAPLTISPKPDTTIRIFLDFQGLDKQINLKTQKLSSIPRKGFTVVEWGGLLVGNK